jgi:hypothetical protein
MFVLGAIAPMVALPAAELMPDGLTATELPPWPMLLMGERSVGSTLVLGALLPTDVLRVEEPAPGLLPSMPPGV